MNHRSLGPPIEPHVDSDIQSETKLEPLFRIPIHNDIDADPVKMVILSVWLGLEALLPGTTANARIRFPAKRKT